MFKGLGTAFTGTILVLVALGVALGLLLQAYCTQAAKIADLQAEVDRLTEECAEAEARGQQLAEELGECRAQSGEDRQVQETQAEERQAGAVGLSPLAGVGVTAAAAGLSLAYAIEQRQRASREKAQKELLLDAVRRQLPYGGSPWPEQLGRRRVLIGRRHRGWGE